MSSWTKLSKKQPLLEAPQAEAWESICGNLFISFLIYIAPLPSGKHRDQEKEEHLCTKDRQIFPNQGASADSYRSWQMDEWERKKLCEIREVSKQTGFAYPERISLG